MVKEIPLGLAFLAGMLMIADLFVPHPLVHRPTQHVMDWAIIVTAFAYVLGVVNVLRINGERVYRRQKDWMYKLVLIIALLVMMTTGIVGGVGERTFFGWLFQSLYVPMQSTMFALLAFFIASAAYRAFRVRTLEATLLLVTAVLVMLGRVPLGERIWSGFPTFTEWIMNVPQLAAKRGIMIGAALGAIATGLKMILGLERSYLGGE
jgi:nitrate reductase NapE component